MKSFTTGLLAVIALGVVGFYTFKATTKFMSTLNPTPSASPSMTSSPTPTPSGSAKPTTTPEPNPSAPATTKGGLPIETGRVKGVSTKNNTTSTSTTTTTTTTSTQIFLTLVKTSICPVSYTTEVKDMTGPLTLKYQLIDNTGFGITIWNSKGEELLQNTTYSGNGGMIKTISGVDYMKIRVESKTCAANNDNWLTLTAER